MIIRPAQPADVEAIFDVRTAVTENILDRSQLAEMGITPATITKMIRQSACAWVAIEDDRVVGFSMADLEGGSLFAAFVLPSREGQGIGKTLVAVAENALFERHAVIWLETGKTTRAAGFYRHLGWANPVEITEWDIRLEKSKPAAEAPSARP
ncbi:GNAT family N-acetyltransferase [Devosia salina]|uniref:GNAT family N-acetyltransferase n=1 Tax=Devosia salina TaxID=2860336 RepID=A0ABX8WEI1_9HYPH|nr:GNAT family N-acetyltransferase [Devosia salina]QYO76818.1 GNAT family N-acetyltransferase [Devosia salina]